MLRERLWKTTVKHLASPAVTSRDPLLWEESIYGKTRVDWNINLCSFFFHFNKIIYFEWIFIASQTFVCYIMCILFYFDYMILFNLKNIYWIRIFIFILSFNLNLELLLLLLLLDSRAISSGSSGSNKIIVVKTTLSLL